MCNKGYYNISTPDIAKEANVSTGIIYQYFNDKKDIFIEIAVLHKKLKEKEVSLDEFIKIRSEIEWRRRYGIFKKMPENYKYVPRRGEFFVID